MKALEADYLTLKQKFDASRARNKVLSNENKTVRNETQKLIDKGIHDDELISALIVSFLLKSMNNSYFFSVFIIKKVVSQAQQASMKTMIEELTALQKESQQSQQDKMSAMAAKNQQENNVIQQLKTIVSEKEAKVKLLEQELIHLKQAVGFH